MLLENLYSHRRLILAMGVSSAFMVALLGILTVIFSETVCGDARCFDETYFLTVHLVQQKSERKSEPTLPDHENQTSAEVQQATAIPQSADTAQTERYQEHVEDQDPPSDPAPARDWNAIAKESARQNVDHRLDREEIRRIMWLRTGSVMFKDGSEFDIREPATIIANRKFKVPVGVLGIGITIGGCFFGIPLAGIPVERRTVGPTVIYCTDIYE